MLEFKSEVEKTGNETKTTLISYVDVLKIRAMFENNSLGALDGGKFEDARGIILQAKDLFGKEKLEKDIMICIPYN